MKLLNLVIPCCLAITSAFILHSCKPESPCNENQTPINETYYLGEETKSKIPYRADGRDTLVFISDAGDTAKLYGQGVKNDYTTKSVNRNGNPDCPMWDTWDYETLTLDFNGLNSGFRNLQIRYKATTDFGIKSDAKNIGYSTTRYLNDTALYDTTIAINGYNFRCLKLDPIPPDTSTYAVFNAKWGVLQLQLGNRIWTRKI